MFLPIYAAKRAAREAEGGGDRRSSSAPAAAPKASRGTTRDLLAFASMNRV